MPTQEALHLHQISKSFAQRPILQQVSLSLNRGERLALVGENGAGKSTLLRLIAGELAVDDGQIRRPAGESVGYLAQETEASDATMTVSLFLREAMGQLHAWQTQLAALEAQMSAPLAEDQLTAVLASYGEVQEQFERRGGYDLDHRLDQVMAGLNLSHIDRTRPLATLSGGEKRRLALAGLLLAQPDLLLLDEPTNHLDQEALTWLEQFLQQYVGAVLLISHDRHFLNEVVSIIAELSPVTHQLTLFHGNYDFYRAERARLFAQEASEWEAQQAEMKRLRQLMKKEAFARGGGHAPRDGNKMAYKGARENAQQTAGKTIQQARQRLAELEATAIARPSRRWSINPEFAPAPLVSQDVIQLRGVSKGFDGRVLFQNVNLTVRNGARVVIMAPNGSGKSTLLKILMGEIEPDKGTAVVAAGAVIGYLDQEQSQLDLAHTVLRAFASTAVGNEKEMRADLHRYALFAGDEVFQKVEQLSIGQRQRLQLAKIAASRANLLLLDEPTNHLDLPSLERLEEMLAGFPGTILAVTHDRWFATAVGTEIWRLTPSGQVVKETKTTQP
jgi:macrolide transport system ATP-binding/permease protein